MSILTDIITNIDEGIKAGKQKAYENDIMRVVERLQKDIEIMREVSIVHYGGTDKDQLIRDIERLLDHTGLDYDPTPWCHICGAMTKDKCRCGPIADND